MGRGSGIMLRLCWKLAAGDYCELKVRMGWTKNRLEKRIVIENHRFDHENRAMLRLCWSLAAGDYCELKSRAGRQKSRI